MSINIPSIKELIKKNLHDMKSVSHVAKNANVGYETLKKTFRRSEGVALSEYLTRLRVAKMKALLAEDRLRCFEICYEVGFDREDTGAKVFKKHTGMTMEEFRTRCHVSSTRDC